MPEEDAPDAPNMADLQNLYRRRRRIHTLRRVLEAITDALTTLVGDHGLYAVFALMLIDAVFPAASEQVVLFGEPIQSDAWACVAMATAGTAGYVIGSILGWGIGLYGGRPLIE